MQIKYDVEIPHSKEEDVEALFRFIEGDKRTMCITYEDKKRARTRSCTLLSYATKNEMNVHISRIECDVFISKLN